MYQLWGVTRWQTYRIMESQVGSEGMRKANLNSPRDLIEFPWEKEPAPTITEEEAAELKAELDAINKQNRKHVIVNHIGRCFNKKINKGVII